MPNRRIKMMKYLPPIVMHPKILIIAIKTQNCVWVQTYKIWSKNNIRKLRTYKTKTQVCTLIQSECILQPIKLRVLNVNIKSTWLDLWSQKVAVWEATSLLSVFLCALASSYNPSESQVRLKRPLSSRARAPATDCFALFGVRAFYWGERALIYSLCTWLRGKKMYSNHTTRWIFDHSTRKKETRSDFDCVYFFSRWRSQRPIGLISFPMATLGITLPLDAADVRCWIIKSLTVIGEFSTRKFTIICGVENRKYFIFLD